MVLVKIPLISLVLFFTLEGPHALEPVDEELIPEGRNILNYLESIWEVKHLTGIHDNSNMVELEECTEKYAAILSLDMTGWNNPKYGSGYPGSYSDVIRNYREKAIEHYNRGGLVEVHFHWPNPLQDQAGFEESKIQLTDEQWANIIQPGTDEYNAMMDDMNWHIDSMIQPLADLNIPVLWRPLHEINGGWFWWTSQNNPGQTAELWRIIFNHMVKTRDLHNLIWIYNDASYNDEIEWRVPFLPGEDYYDIAAIDLYTFDARETGMLPRDWTYDLSFNQVYQMMKELHPGKLIGLGEVQEIPNMEKTAAGDTAFAPWLFSIPWWFNDDGDFNCVNKPCNPCEWATGNYLHEYAITMDELPEFNKDVVYTLPHNGERWAEKRIFHHSGLIKWTLADLKGNILASAPTEKEILSFSKNLNGGGLYFIQSFRGKGYKLIRLK